MRLKDRVAIVTGAASGIGAASALAMAAEGARVLVVDLNESGAKATVERIEKAGGQAAAARADVTRAADSQSIVERRSRAGGVWTSSTPTPVCRSGRPTSRTSRRRSSTRSWRSTSRACTSGPSTRCP